MVSTPCPAETASELTILSDVRQSLSLVCSTALAWVVSASLHEARAKASCLAPSKVHWSLFPASAYTMFDLYEHAVLASIAQPMNPV